MFDFLNVPTAFTPSCSHQDYVSLFQTQPLGRHENKRLACGQSLHSFKLSGPSLHLGCSGTLEQESNLALIPAGK